MPLKASSASPVLEPIGRVTDLWLDPASAIRQKGIEALQVSTGYSRAIVERALTHVFEELTRDKLSDFIRSEQIHFDSRSQAVVLHIGAGNVFTSWLHGAVITLLLGHRCRVKPSSIEPVFARLWHESVRMIDFAAADRISIVPWDEKLLTQAQAVVAYGSDSALNELRQKTKADSIFIGYGHKISAALAFNEAMESGQWQHWRQRAIEDCEMFDLNGCLSPKVLYVEEKTLRAWAWLSESVRPAPELRSFTRLDEVLEDLRRFDGVLSAIGVAGPLERLDPLRSDLERLGATRFCELGRMQRPPLSWRNGGVSLAEALRPLNLAKSDGNA